jgi:hypothetical protein
MKPLLPALAEIRMEFWVMISVASTGLKTHRRTHTCMPIELIPLTLTVERDLQEWPSAQRLPAFS